MKMQSYDPNEATGLNRSGANTHDVYRMSQGLAHKWGSKMKTGITNRFWQLVLVIILLLAAGSAAAATSLPRCDISGLSCFTPGKKCNIKFRNHTGEGSGSGGSQYNQVSAARTVVVSIRGTDGSRLGSKKEILAGDSKTVDVGMKQSEGIGEIRIRAKTDKAWSGDESVKVAMGCKKIKDILNGEGNCKIFMYKESGDTNVAYSCNGGSIMGN